MSSATTTTTSLAGNLARFVSAGIDLFDFGLVGDRKDDAVEHHRHDA